MKKLTSLVVALCATLFVSATTVTITPSAWGEDGKTSSPYEAISYTLGTVTVSSDSAACTGSQIRVYTGGKLTIESTDNITKVEITTQAGDKGGDKYSASALSGTGYSATTGATSGVWTGSSKSITLSASKQVRILQIVVTTDGTGVDPVVEVDTITVAKALQLIAASDNKAHYIIGVVAQSFEKFNDGATATFYLKDADASNSIQAYSMYYEKVGGAWGSNSLAVGDTVLVYGNKVQHYSDGKGKELDEINGGYFVEMLGKGPGGGEGEGEEIKGLVYAEAYWDTDEEYWEFDLYKDYNESTGETVYPEVYFSVSGGSETSIVDVEYDSEYDYGFYVKAKGDTIWFTDAEISIVCIGEGEYRISGTFVGDDSNEYSFELATEVYAYACTWNDEYGEYDYEDIYLEDVPTAVRSIEIDENVYARDGRIYAEEGARIYTLTGLDVTRQNGSLNGVYVVRTTDKVATVIVRK